VLRRVESWDWWLAAVWEGRGEVGWERRRRRNRGVGRGGRYIMAFTDGMYPSVIPSVLPPVKVPRHCTAISI